MVRETRTHFRFHDACGRVGPDEVGRTRVICTASVEDRVPPFLRATGKGWVTAEYGMLPRATNTRSQREASAGKVGGRTQEIQRLIGRVAALRHVAQGLGERTIYVDCDVIQADGGTRTASSPAASSPSVLGVRETPRARPHLARAHHRLRRRHERGVIDGTPMLDLAYEEDSARRSRHERRQKTSERPGTSNCREPLETKPFESRGAGRAAGRWLIQGFGS
jgi:ribonuclease PH